MVIEMFKVINNLRKIVDITKPFEIKLCVDMWKAPHFYISIGGKKFTIVEIRESEYELLDESDPLC